jgi:hypothetical protein
MFEAFYYKNKMARPKNTIPTSTKTISVNDVDIKYIEEESNIPYKHIIALGVQAHKKGWNESRDSKEIENLNLRVEKLATTLNRYTQKFSKLAEIVEGVVDVKIDDELKNIGVIEKKLNNKVKKLDEIKK